MAAEVNRLEVPGIPISSIFDWPWLCSDEDAKKTAAIAEEKRRAATAEEKWRAPTIRAEEQKRAATIRAEVIRRKNEIYQIAREDALESLLDAVDTVVILEQNLSNNIWWQMTKAGFIASHPELYVLLGFSRAYSTHPYGNGFFRAVGIKLDHQTNERIKVKLVLLAGDVQGGGRNRNPRQITGRNADHSAIQIRVAVPTGGPDAGGGGGPDADGRGGPDAGGGGGPPGGGPDAGGGGGPPGGGPDAGSGGGPDAGGGGGPDAGGGGNLAVCVFTASVGKAALLRYTATAGSSRSRSGSTKSEVLSYLIMTFDTVAFLTSFAAIYMRRKRPQVSTILENVSAFSLILGFLCMNMKAEFPA